MVNRFSPEETKAHLDSAEGYVYVDVRTVPEFEAGHVPGAKNVPVFEPGPGGMAMNPQFVEVVAKNYPKDAKLICGCQMGGRSLKAAQILQAAGFTNVADMRGGFVGETDFTGQIAYPGWASRGLPVSRESNPEDRYDSLQSK